MAGTVRLVGAPRGFARAGQVKRLMRALDQADAVVVGAGAGLSTSAGLTYAGARFDRWFSDFAQKYGFSDMYSGGFWMFESLEEHWAYWSRFIWCNRYGAPVGTVYRDLLDLLQGRDWFVLTTNVDHQFQRAGFDRKRLFYTQGDYGLWQCSVPCHRKTYDNEDRVRAMMEAQGYVAGADGEYALPGGARPAMTVPEELVPTCPVCGKPLSMNLRSDDTFVEDEGWHAAAARWADFKRRHEGMRVLYLELGVGWNTPGIIKVPFWQAVAANPKATYACINQGEAVVPAELEDQSILVDGDIATVLHEMRSHR